MNGNGNFMARPTLSFTNLKLKMCPRLKDNIFNQKQILGFSLEKSEPEHTNGSFKTTILHCFMLSLTFSVVPHLKSVQDFQNGAKLSATVTSVGRDLDYTCKLLPKPKPG